MSRAGTQHPGGPNNTTQTLSGTEGDDEDDDDDDDDDGTGVTTRRGYVQFQSRAHGP